MKMFLVFSKHTPHRLWHYDFVLSSHTKKYENQINDFMAMSGYQFDIEKSLVNMKLISNWLNNENN